MSKYLVSDTQLTSVANAIRTKGGTSNSLSFPDGFVSAIGNIPSGGSTPSSGPVVKFYDYDGTLITTKTKDEVNAMTSDSDLPANPSHTGLVAEGWNWTVSELKAQLLACPESDVIVGQTYDTVSGDTEIYIKLTSTKALSPTLRFVISDGAEASIDWGDNTTPTSVTGTSGSTQKKITHDYATTGDYKISVHVVSGNFYIGGMNSSVTFLGIPTTSTFEQNKRYSSCIQHIRFSSNVTKISTYAIKSSSSLKTMTISKRIATATNYIDNHAFVDCSSLEFAVIPSGFTKLNADVFKDCSKLKMVSLPGTLNFLGAEVFKSNPNLRYVTIPFGVTTIGASLFQDDKTIEFLELPSGITSFGSGVCNGCYALNTVIIHFTGDNCFKSNNFNYCFNLKRLDFPLNNNLTNLETYALAYCLSLTSFSIPNTITSLSGYCFEYALFDTIIIPNGVKTIGVYAFAYCNNLREITIPNSVTSLGGNMFYYATNLHKITVPNSVTTVPNYFCGYCYSLVEVVIPEGITTVGQNAFYRCYSLEEITMPSTVTSINTKAFSTCSSLKEITFLSETPPTLQAAAVFENLPSDCKIYVPYSADHSILNAYMTADYWSTYASKMEELPAPTT